MNTEFLLQSCNSWADFQAKLVALNKKEKGNAFELLSKLFFKINPVYSFYEEVWLLSEVPQKTLEFLGIPSHDLGIDLIAKVGDEFHAIQCKFHTESDSSVSFKEVATFISLLEGNKKFTQGYICSSANITSRNFEKIETKPITTILADTWQNLDADFFDKLRKYLNKEKFAPLPFQPKAHQIQAINDAKQFFGEDKSSRGKLIFPCGAGKSLTGYWLTQELNSKATLIAVPSLSLVKQTLDVYLREIVAAGKKVKWLCICSDEGIGTADDIVFKTENLGVPCQTDPVYIKRWLNENQQENIVVFTTYQSGKIIAEISKELNFKFDVGIFDEAHKTVGSSKKLFSHLLFEENIAIDKRIFMTATERFYAGSKDEIISMDDEEIYGDIFSQMSFKDAIDLGLLTDYKVITIDIQKSEIADFIKQNNLIQLDGKWQKETEARSLASMLALRKAMRLFPIKNAVSFHSSIEKATRNKELQSYISDTYNYAAIDTYTVSGKMPTTKRNVVIQEFANSPQALITNARCLTEGVDVPNIDCIVFSDPRKSKVDIVQALGRALRKKEGKDWGYVILPVIYDDKTQEIDNENFNEILAIVRGLASNDDRIIEYFKDKKEGLPTIKKDKTAQFQFEVFSDFVDAELLAQQLQVKLWEKLSRFQWMPFEEAREYVRGLGLKDQKEWLKYCKSGNRVDFIPSNPDKAYKDSGWLSYPDWLGINKGFSGYSYLTYSEAKEVIKQYNLNSQSDWSTFLKSGKKPFNIPSAPDKTYKKSGWINWGDWLGTGRIADKFKIYLEYKDAQSFVKQLNLKTQKDWLAYCKSGNKPDNIPAKPQRTYLNNGWKGFGEWLGTNTISSNQMSFLPFNEAKLYLLNLNLNLKSIQDWNKFLKSGLKPNNIPSDPSKVYKDKGWKSFGDWLGTNRIADQLKEYLDYDTAKKYVNKLHLKNENEWRLYCKSGRLIESIPRTPSIVYKNKGWNGFGDWLGTGRVKAGNVDYLSFEQAKKTALTFNIFPCTEKNWRTFCKTGQRPINIPYDVSKYYKSEWKGWADFLGKE